ncbi:hypothetical protein PROVRETT_06395 [Providencia rettgeri DSM 1131]|nr:hypothetical protein PROVRETT_06395 [Providencia rettgeri DSM 1131]
MIKTFLKLSIKLLKQLLNKYLVTYFNYFFRCKKSGKYKHKKNVK